MMIVSLRIEGTRRMSGILDDSHERRYYRSP